jgi:hypothetical protein|tara:strand:- start:4107 stop:6338 length:2232 start_codon:yes stop_codon:yes gene_type:complete
MKGTLFSADFVKDNSGNPRLLEINTDTMVIADTHDDVIDYSAFHTLLNDNNIAEVHVVAKVIHIPWVNKLSASIAANCPAVTTFNETIEEVTTVYPTAVADAEDKFILRMAYDENAILDSTYAKTDFNTYKLFHDNSAGDKVVEVYHSSSLGEIDNLNEQLNPANTPDFAIRATLPAKLGIGWYKLGKSSLSIADRINEFKNISDDFSIITNYYNSGNQSTVKSLRSFQIVYGDNLDLCYLGQYEIDALLPIAGDITVDDSIIANKVPKKHYFEYSTNDISDDDGVWQEEGVNLEAGGSHIAKSAVVGSEYDAYFVSGSPDTDSNAVLSKWSISGPGLPAGSKSTSSILEAKVSQSIASQAIRKVTFTDGTELRAGGGNRILCNATESNSISYQLVRDLKVGYEVFDKEGNRKTINNTQVEILDKEADALTVQLSVESVDNYIVSQSSAVLHNAPCFAAGTKIYVEGGEKNIEDIVVGEKVLSYNHENNITEFAVVEEVLHKEEKQSVVVYHFEEELTRELIATHDHPLHVFESGYASYTPYLTFKDSGIEVAQIKEGDKITNYKGGFNTISQIEVLDEPVKVYNLSKIKDNNNFFANQVLVHNRWGISGGCFTEGSLIEMFDGSSKAIEKVKVGDEVKTMTGEKGIVRDTLIHPVKDISPVYSNGVVGSDPDHPIYLDGKWTTPKKAGWDSEWKYLDNYYNLEIEGGEHTYVIGGVIASGLGDNKELNEKYQRQPKELIKHL